MILKRNSGAIGYDGNGSRPNGGRRRLYPRLEIMLRQLQEPGARLTYHPDGRYRLNGLPGRVNVCVPRTLKKLIALRAVQGQAHGILAISAGGRQLLRKVDRKRHLDAMKARWAAETAAEAVACVEEQHIRLTESFSSH